MLFLFIWYFHGKRKYSLHVSVIPAVNKPINFDRVYQLSSVYNPFPFLNKKWSHSAFLTVSPEQALQLIGIVTSALFICYDLICIIFYKPFKFNYCVTLAFRQRKGAV